MFNLVEDQKTEQVVVREFPVIVNDIRPTKPTIALTGIDSYDQLIKEKGKLFGNLKDTELNVTILEQLHKGKLAAKDARKLTELSVADKRQYLIDNLTVTVELTQEIERVNSDSAQNNLGKVFGLFMTKRIGISSSESTKYAFQASSFYDAQALNLKIGMDFSEAMSKQNTFIYITRYNSFEPVITKEGYVTSTPKRAGKDGDILIKDDKLIFMHTQLVVEPNVDIVQQQTFYNALYKSEIENAKIFTADKDKSIPADSVPSEIRNPDGTFEEEYQAWLNRLVKKQSNQQVIIA